MSETSVTRDSAHAPSADAARQRRRRHRLETGTVLIEVAVGSSGLDGLVSCGWLPHEDRANRNAVKSAMVALVIYAIQRNIRRP